VVDWCANGQYGIAKAARELCHINPLSSKVKPLQSPPSANASSTLSSAGARR
jgi:hypothetical protein